LLWLVVAPVSRLSNAQGLTPFGAALPELFDVLAEPLGGTVLLA
jgi:hypothetical protein